jgi:DnaJ-class molecular chaperone
MNMFFGGGGRQGPARREMQKVKPTKKALDVTLEQVYNGGVVKVTHERTRCCETCKGKGGENVKTCTACKGKGRVVQVNHILMKMYQMGPGMYQQVQKNCDPCKGEGEVISEGGKCKSCLGKKIVTKEKTVEVPV